MSDLKKNKIECLYKHKFLYVWVKNMREWLITIWRERLLHRDRYLNLTQLISIIIMTIQNICNWLVSRHANPSEDILTQMTTGLDNDRVAVDSVRERENVLIIKTKLSSRFSLCRGSTFAVSEAFQWNPQLAGARFSYTKRRLNRGAFGLTPGSLTWSPWFTSYFHRFICV